VGTAAGLAGTRFRDSQGGMAKEPELMEQMLTKPEFWFPGDLAYCRIPGRFQSTQSTLYRFRMLVLNPQLHTNHNKWTAEVLVLENEEFPNTIGTRITIFLGAFSLEARP